MSFGWSYAGAVDSVAFRGASGLDDLLFAVMLLPVGGIQRAF